MGQRSSEPRKILSRLLCRLLRHQAAERGLSVDSAGYVPVQQILETPEIQKLQQDIISSQEKEIAQMKALLDEMKK